MAFEENSYDRLAELNGSKFEVIKGEPDITGWKVKTEDGLKVGRVDDLLFNPASQKVKYMIVNFSGNELHVEGDRQVLIPINIADLYSDKDYEKSVISTSSTEYISRNNAYNPAKDGDVVVLPGITIAQLNSLPLYEKNHLSPDIERAIRKILERPAPAERKEPVHHANPHKESSENTHKQRQAHKK
jgi:hypothetical protein